MGGDGLVRCRPSLPRLCSKRKRCGKFRTCPPLAALARRVGCNHSPIPEGTSGRALGALLKSGGLTSAFSSEGWEVRLPSGAIISEPWSCMAPGRSSSAEFCNEDCRTKRWQQPGDGRVEGRAELLDTKLGRHTTSSGWKRWARADNHNFPAAPAGFPWLHFVDEACDISPW